MQNADYLQRLVDLGAVVSPGPNGTRLVQMARKAVVPRKTTWGLIKFTVKEKGCWHVEVDMDYPTIWDGKRTCRMHRFFYELFVGPLGDLYGCHTCDNTKCINPAHIFPGTQADNLADASRKGRIYKGGAKVPWTRTKTHCIRGHELSGSNLSSYKKRRVCIACQKFHRDKAKGGK